jgi:hypothetical protein
MSRSTRTIVISLVVLLVLSAISYRLRTVIASSPFDRYHLQDLAEANIPLSLVLDRLAEDIETKVSSYDAHSAKADLEVDLSHVSLQHYVQELNATCQEFLGATPHLPLDSVLDHLSLVPSSRQGIDKRIYTTDLAPPTELPQQFQSWTTMNPEWKTIFVSDDKMDAWLDSVVPGSAGIVREMKWLRERKGIVMADMFR